MPCLLLIFSQSDYLIWIIALNPHIWRQTVQIQISWLLQKPTDLDLHCLQRQGISGFSRTRVKILKCSVGQDQPVRSSVQVALKCSNAQETFRWSVDLLLTGFQNQITKMVFHAQCCPSGFQKKCHLFCFQNQPFQVTPKCTCYWLFQSGELNGSQM